MLSASLALLCVALSVSSAFRVSENVVFEKVRDITIARSEWMFTFFVDLQSYQGYMASLGTNIRRAEGFLGKVIFFMKFRRETNIDPYTLDKRPSYSLSRRCIKWPSRN